MVAVVAVMAGCPQETCDKKELEKKGGGGAHEHVAHEEGVVGAHAHDAAGDAVPAEQKLGRSQKGPQGEASVGARAAYLGSWPA